MKITKEKVLEVLAWSAFVITLSGIMGIFSSPPKSQQASAVQGFDHSQCQYPERTTNPVDGCDNSDPCDPLNAAKGGSGECSDVYSQPTTQQETAKPIEPAPSQCGGGK